MLHRHEFVQILNVERPSIDDLLADGIDQFDDLAFVQTRGLAAARRNLDHVVLHPLIFWRV
jgi:hypothetical protein